MKTLLFFILALFYFQKIAAQKAVVANLRMNVAYIGIPNPLGILAEDYSWSDIEVTTDNGKIEKDEEERSYQYYPKNAGKAYIILKSKKGDTIGIQQFWIRNLPNPIPEMGGQNGDKVAKNRLLIYPGLTAPLKNFDIDIRIVVKTFSITIIRNDSSIFVKSHNGGPLFSEELKQQFNKTKNGDKLIFYGITAQGPDKRILELSPMEFTIIEE